MDEYRKVEEYGTYGILKTKIMIMIIL